MNSRESLQKKSKEELIDHIIDLYSKIDSLIKTVAELKQDVDRLTKEVTHLKQPKNSRNSSLPPSKDLFKFKNQSTREKSNKKSGGQPGHKGETLMMSAMPDQIISHYPSQTCHVCGRVHDMDCVEIAGKRQVFDIPIIKPIITEHLIYRSKCTCGHTSEASFPPHVTAPVQYGNNLTAMVAYLSARQYVPMSRLSELVHCFTNISLSQGTIHNMLDRVARSMTPVYEGIKKDILSASTVGADETGMKVNDKNHWAWVWQTLKETFIVISKSRGFNTIEENFPDGFPNAIYVSDSLSAQLKVEARLHQLCLAHIIRELNYFIDKHQSSWATKMKALLKSAIALKNRMTDDDYTDDYPERNEVIERFTKLIEEKINDQIPNQSALHKRLIKHQNHMFNFLYHLDVPFDNNGSERAIRNVKVKQKVSGAFRSERGAEIFAIIRSVVDTFIKRGRAPLDEIIFAVNLATAVK